MLFPSKYKYEYKLYAGKQDTPTCSELLQIFKMADLSHIGFQGSNDGALKSPCRTSYRSSIETVALNCLVFEKIAFLYFGYRQTNRQMDSTDAVSRSRCGERRLNNSG